MKEQNTKWPFGPTSSSVRKSWLSISTVIAFAVATIWFFRPYLFPYATPQPSFFTTHNDLHAPLENIWAELSDDEFKALTAFLYDASNGLNLIPTTNASTGNIIHRIEALRPNKTEVLSYTRGLAESSPLKWAHVIIDQGVWPNTSLNEYMVGPLPINKQTKIIPLTYLHNSGRSSTRNVAPPKEMVSAWAREVYLEVGDIIQDLLGEDVTLGNETNIKDVELQGQTPHLEGDRLISWCSLMSPGVISESPSLLIQGLYMRIDTTDSDSGAWQITRWMYNGIVYESTEEFRAAIKRGDFERTPFNLDGPWTTLEDFGPGTKGRELPPPVMVQTTPPRYGVDRKQDYVSWMGFTFYIAFSQVTGITLYDIKFDGEPIIYELGLQEALAHYAGDDPMQGNRVFLDTFYNMGELMFELVPGYDCPAYASFLDTKFYKNGEKVVNKNSICLFEFTADYALQRHSASNYVSVSRNTFFVVRTVSTVGNYDYTIEYIFYLDGVIEVKIRASGFIFSSYWSPQSSPDYGFRVHDQVATGIHTHVLNFKADVDIGGTLNTMTRVGIEGTSIDYPYDSLPPRHTMHLTWETVTEETGLNWPANTAETFFIGNNDSVNAWGQKRGYLVRSGTGMGNPVHLVVKNSTAIGKAVEWANMDLWVAKQKDTEAKSASPYNVLDIHDPIIDFSKFIDGENIEQEDLVIYFNLGGHHVPHSGDIPNTLMHTSASSVMFLPYNFHDRDPSRHSSTGVRVDLKDRNKTQYYGGRIKEGLSVKLNEIEPDMTEYKAKDHPVRKFFGIHG